MSRRCFLRGLNLPVNCLRSLRRNNILSCRQGYIQLLDRAIIDQSATFRHFLSCRIRNWLLGLHHLFDLDVLLSPHCFCIFCHGLKCLFGWSWGTQTYWLIHSIFKILDVGFQISVSAYQRWEDTLLENYFVGSHLLDELGDWRLFLLEISCNLLFLMVYCNLLIVGIGRLSRGLLDRALNARLSCLSLTPFLVCQNFLDLDWHALPHPYWAFALWRLALSIFHNGL